MGAEDEQRGAPQTSRRPSVVFAVDDPSAGSQAKKTEELWYNKSRMKQDLPRKTVSLPRTLGELQQAALLHHEATTGGKLGTGYRLRLFLDGRELAHQADVRGVQDGAEVVIKLERFEAHKYSGHQYTSTTRSAYQAFAVKPKAQGPVVSNARGSTLSDQAMSSGFEGQTTYRANFVTFDPKLSRPAESTKVALYGSNFLKSASNTSDASGMSTYAANFFWHDVRPSDGAAASNVRHSAIGEQLFGHRFDAKSSYGTDFAKRDRFVPPAKICGGDTSSRLTADTRGKPFEGRSRYSVDYIVYDVDGRQKSARPPPFEPDVTDKFAGKSEYRQSYVSYEAKPPTLHLLADI